MVSSNLKSKSDDFLKPLGQGLARAGISPNSLTATGLVVMLIAGYFLYEGELFLGAVIVLIGGFLDMLDGLVARHGGTGSPRGAFLDSVSDRVADMAILSGVILGGHIEEFLGMSGLFWGLVALTGAILTSYARAIAEANGVSMMGKGIIERPERLIIFCLAAMIGYLTVGIFTIAVLGWVTVLQRVVGFYRSSGEKS